jgi:glycosyltransferase involved in cell wall biosynthesis
MLSPIRNPKSKILNPKRPPLISFRVYPNMSPMQQRLISVVVPVYNEQDSLHALTREILSVAADNALSVQIVFVDDGSQDSSWTKIIDLTRTSTAIGGLRFRHNSGKAAALMAGFAVAQGDLVFMMDADLQDPPLEIPRFIEGIGVGWDVVSGWKQHRFDPWHKVYPSRVFNWLVSRLTGVHLHDHVCGFKCFRREVLREISIHGELHRFLGVLAAAKGFQVTEIPTLHRPRTTGVSKYGFTRFFKGFLDLLTVWMLTRYRWRPQHIIGTAGLVYLALWLLSWIPLLGRFLAIPLGLAPAFILIAIGLAAEMIVASRPIAGLYTVVEKVGWCATDSTTVISNEP